MEVLRLISSLKDLYGLPKIEGGCLKFHLFLLMVFPNAKGYYNGRHVITKIGSKYYDRKGEYDGSMGPVEEFLPMSDYGEQHFIDSFQVKLSKEEKNLLSLSVNG